MNHDELRELFDGHFSADAPGGRDSRRLAEQLAADPDARQAFVERARLEQGLTDALAGQSVPDLERLIRRKQRPSRSPKILLLGVAALGICVLVALVDLFIQNRAGSPASEEGLAQLPRLLDRGSAEAWPSVLPRPATRKVGAPAGWVSRLEKYILPEVDLRGLPVSQAVARVVAEVHALGFRDAAPEFVVRYPVDPEAVEPVVHLRREHLPLVDTLVYLAAVGGRTNLELGMEIRIARQGVSPHEETGSLTVPAHFLLPEGAPDYIETSAEGAVSEDRAAEPETRLREWGVDLGKVSALDYDPDSRTFTFTAEPAQHAVLRAAAALASNTRGQIAIEMQHYRVPRAALGKALPFAAEEIVRFGKVMESYGTVTPVELLEFQEQTLADADTGADTQILRVSFPRVITESGREVELYSGQELVVNGETDWTGIKYRCLPVLRGERLALDFRYETRDMIGVRVVDGEEIPVVTGSVHAAQQTLVDPDGASFRLRSDPDQDYADLILTTVEASPAPAGEIFR